MLYKQRLYVTEVGKSLQLERDTYTECPIRIPEL